MSGRRGLTDDLPVGRRPEAGSEDQQGHDLVVESVNGRLAPGDKVCFDLSLTFETHSVRNQMFGESKVAKL